MSTSPSNDIQPDESLEGQHTARHVCHCGKSFIRKEHLRRHQASHSAGARSHVCHICQRSFNRNDVLRRHVTRHSTTAPPDARRGRACDACFGNKTKCDGGAHCSLCTRRNISCTFSRDIQGQSMDIMKDPDRIPTEIGDEVDSAPSTNGGTPMDLEWPTISISSLPVENTSKPDKSSGSMKCDTRKKYMSLFKALAKAPSGGTEAQEIFREIDKVAEAAQDEIDFPGEDDSTPIGIRDITSIRQQWRSLDTIRTLSTTHSKLYFKHFHHRWPILHAPTFDEETGPFVITASVGMIGAWFEGSQESRNLALTIHDRLMNHLSQKMATPVENRRKMWTIPIYQATLINIIFGLYSGRKKVIARIILLHSLFVAGLREVEFFRTETPQQVKAFRPYMFSIQEGRKRLASMIFKIDNYLSNLRGQPPILDRDELCFKVSSTFALWNSHGIFAFYKREPEEPNDRERLHISAVMANPQPLMSSPLLIEDIQLGMCSMQQAIWRYSQFRHRGFEVVSTEVYSQDSLLSRLSRWKEQLDKTSTKLSSQAKDPSIPGFPFKAYLGAENSDSPNWRDTVSFRISTLIFDTTMLYHLLSLQLFTDLWTLTMIAATVNGPCPLNSPKCPPIEDQESRTYLWASSSDARRALLHSVTVVAALTTGLSYDSSVAQREIREGTTDPITHMSVATSALILWSYISHTSETCTCVPDLNYMSSGLELVRLQEGSKLDNWVKNGGLAAVDGVSICKCNLSLLMGKFTSALPTGERWWEMSRVIAPMLWRPATMN